MPSGRLAFSTRSVDLMVAGMRTPLALCVDGCRHSTKRGKKLEQVRVQGAPVAFLIFMVMFIYILVRWSSVSV